MGTTGRLNQIWDRYSYLVRAEALRLDDTERQVLLSVLSGSLVDVSFLTGLALELRNSDDYIEGGGPPLVLCLRRCLRRLTASVGRQIEVVGF
ncbi:MAG: hypothetical protein ACRC9W_09895 [Plesiomonas sp.]